jgi:hypothetical protein
MTLEDLRLVRTDLVFPAFHEVAMGRALTDDQMDRIHQAMDELLDNKDHWTFVERTLVSKVKEFSGRTSSERVLSKEMLSELVNFLQREFDRRTRQSTPQKGGVAFSPPDGPAAGSVLQLDSMTGAKLLIAAWPLAQGGAGGAAGPVEAVEAAAAAVEAAVGPAVGPAVEVAALAADCRSLLCRRCSRQVQHPAPR